MELKRPTYRDPAAEVEVAEKMANKIQEWLKGGGEESEYSELLADCIKVIKHTTKGDDGYSIAKDFEDLYYQPDARLVELLDSTTFWMHDAETKAVTQWVKDNNIQPKLAVGDKVSAKLSSFKTITGEISSIKDLVGQYCILDGHITYIAAYENTTKLA